MTIQGLTDHGWWVVVLPVALIAGGIGWLLSSLTGLMIRGDAD